MTHDYYILKGREIKSTKDVLEWGQWFEAADNTRIIKQENSKLNYWVSTVFLGVDYNFSNEGEPILFETMVFNSKKESAELDSERYRTYAEAELGHALMVAKWSKRKSVYKYKFSEWWRFKYNRIGNWWRMKFKRKGKKL